MSVCRKSLFGPFLVHLYINVLLQTRLGRRLLETCSCGQWPFPTRQWCRALCYGAAGFSSPNTTSQRSPVSAARLPARPGTCCLTTGRVPRTVSLGDSTRVTITERLTQTRVVAPPHAVARSGVVTWRCLCIWSFLDTQKAHPVKVRGRESKRPPVWGPYREQSRQGGRGSD